MAKVRRVDFSPDEFLVGVAGLKPDEIGAYWVACSLMYSRGGPIADDESWIARACGCHVRTWRAIKARLIAAGKLILRDGLLLNERCLREIERAEGRLKQSRGASEESVKARRARMENDTDVNDYKDIPEAAAGNQDELSPTINEQLPTINLESHPEAASSLRLVQAAADAPKGSEKSQALRVSANRATVDEAYRVWLEAAQAENWPDPGFLNSTRRAQLAERLSECGGLERWREAIAKMRGAGFLRLGGKPKRWVHLGVLLDPEKFSRLLSGFYDDADDKSDDDVEAALERSRQFGQPGYRLGGER